MPTFTTMVSFNRNRRLDYFFLILFILPTYIIYNIFYSGHFTNFVKTILIMRPPRVTFKSLAKPRENEACNIPKLDPFHPSVSKFLEIPKQINCTHPLLFGSNSNSLIILNDKDIKSCCYKAVWRVDERNFNTSSNCTLIPLRSRVIPVGDEHVVIECQVWNSTENLVETKAFDMHSFVHLKPEVETRIEKYYKKVGKGMITDLSEREKVNVVVFGIDAVSKMNFLRVMPQTHKYLVEELKAIGMNGYNKVGDNTFPNIAAVLAASNTSEMDKCDDNGYDECPFIWKKFGEKGYRTAYLEDGAVIGTFNYAKYGFKAQPTDYYLRPFSVAAEKLISSNDKYCYGPRLSFEVMVEQLKKMAEGMGMEKRYFQFVWENGLTHEDLNYGRLGDKRLVEGLKWLNEEGYLNKTVFILMSDHGFRTGDIQKTLQGQLEGKLPFLYFVAPKWLQKKYPKAFNNLRRNGERARLTTPFDLHETLIDLMDLNRLGEVEVEERQKALEQALPRGISQFLAIPPSRTCEMAEIPQHFCSCRKLKEVKSNRWDVEQAGNFVVFEINKSLMRKEECAVLRVDKIKLAYEIDYGWGEVVKGFELTVETSPGHALFQAGVMKRKNQTWKLTGPVGRANLYGNQSHCVDEKELKLTCYCVDKIK